MSIITVTLKKPIAFGDEELITELTLREPVAGDLMKADRAKGNIEKSLIIISECAGQPLPVMKKLGLKDLEALSKVLEDFTGPSPETGAS